MDKEKFINLELLGLIFTSVVGLILKYSIMIFGVNLWTLLISSVNRSIWEETKVFALSYLLWSAIEYCIINIPLREFVVSKVVGMYTLLILGIIVFWMFNYVIGVSNLLAITS